MLGFLLSSHDGTCGGRRSLLLRSDLSSALDVMHRHTHTPVLIDLSIEDLLYIQYAVVIVYCRVWLLCNSEVWR